MTAEDLKKIKYGVRDNYCQYASDLTREEAVALIKRLEEESKRNGTYYPDRFILTYRLPS